MPAAWPRPSLARIRRQPRLLPRRRESSRPDSSTSVITTTREREVHHRAHDQHLESLPLGLGQELVRGAGASVLGCFAGHLDVAAERDGADAVFRVAAAERQKLRAKAQREREDADADPSRHHEVAELVYENQYAEHEKESQDAGHTLDFTLPGQTFDCNSNGRHASDGEVSRPLIDRRARRPGPEIAAGPVRFVSVHRLAR